MNLLPYENIEIASKLKKEEIEEYLRNSIAWTTDFGIFSNKNSIRDYEGFVENGTFKIRRILKSGRNSFIPVVTGTIKENVNGFSIVSIKLRLNKIVLGLAISMTLFSGSILITSFTNRPIPDQSSKEYLIEELSLDKELAGEIVKNMDKPPTKQPKTNWMSIFLFFAPYLMCTIFFNYEAGIIKDKLNSTIKKDNVK